MEAQSHRTDEVRASAGCADAKPAVKNVGQFKTVLPSNREAMAKLTLPGLKKI